jgi:glycosyltransferase involved in cell wall biosynthesis
MPPGERILLMTYFFPPAGGVSVQRALSLAKYLPADGCQLDVLTTRNGVYPVRDEALLGEVPASVQIHRAFTPEPPYGLRKRAWNIIADPLRPAGPTTHLLSNVQRLTKSMVQNVLFPDPQVLWNRWAFAAASELIRKRGYDTLVVTAPPFSSFLAGNRLKQRFPGLRLVSDFRDDWIGFFLEGVDALAGGRKRDAALRIERETVETADLVVAATEATLQDIRSRYPEQPAAKFAVVHNGYDPDALRPCACEVTAGSRMVVTYVGTVYGPCSPRHYLDAVDSLPEEIRSRMETRFVGRVIDAEAAVLQRRNSMVRSVGFVPHAEAVRHMSEADFLLLVIDDEKTLSGKIFEYLATGKPVIALTPPAGESGRLIRATRSGHVVEPRDARAIADLLHRLCIARSEGRHGLAPDWDLIRQFERPRLAAKYRRLIQEQRPAA